MGLYRPYFMNSKSHETTSHSNLWVQLLPCVLKTVTTCPYIYCLTLPWKTKGYYYQIWKSRSHAVKNSSFDTTIESDKIEQNENFNLHTSILKQNTKKQCCPWNLCLAVGENEAEVLKEPQCGCFVCSAKLCFCVHLLPEWPQSSALTHQCRKCCSSAPA